MGAYGKGSLFLGDMAVSPSQLAVASTPAKHGAAAEQKASASASKLSPVGAAPQAVMCGFPLLPHGLPAGPGSQQQQQIVPDSRTLALGQSLASASTPGGGPNTSTLGGQQQQSLASASTPGGNPNASASTVGGNPNASASTPTLCHEFMCTGTKPTGSGRFWAFRLTLWSDNQVRVQKEGEVLGPAHGEWMMSPTSNCVVVTFTATGRDLVQSTLVRVGDNTYLKTSSSCDYQFVAAREGPTIES